MRIVKFFHKIRCHKIRYCMKRIWFFIVLSSIATLLFVNPEDCVNALMNAGSDAVTLTIKLLGIYAVWLGIIALVDATGLSNKMANLLEPIIDWLFGKTDAETKRYLALNLSTNILGLGNACTPTGLKAMEGLDKLNGGATTASTAMIMLIVLNATSIQLLPTTVIGLRQQYGSTSSSDIILPTLVATIISTALAILFVKVLAKLKRYKKR